MKIGENESVIGVDLGGTKISAGIVKGGELIRESFREIDATQPKESIITQVVESIDEFWGPDIVGIGVGVPSLVDLEQGIVYEMQNIPSWDLVPLKAILQNIFPVPVFINNDANCFVIGEKMYGAGRDYQHVAGITLGTGIGCGLVIDGKLYSGANCCAGEFGNVPYLDGIYEDYCSGKFFFEKSGMKGKALSQLARSGDANALKIMDEYGMHLGRFLKTVMMVFDPELIVFGGSIKKDFEYFSESLFQELKTFPYKQCVESIIVVPSTIGNGPVMGASALCQKEPMEADLSLTS